ncbi:dihydrolipoyl dehydrogenase [Clostridia bacterium]|nr:dihydrolipoyl dehydrogenase [Clostridia bacterium]
MGNFITMPKLGMTMTEGTITKWLVEEGAAVEKGDYIFETETDKTALEVDSLYGGTLLKIYHNPGDTVSVNEPVAFIGAEGEEIPELPVPVVAVAETAASTVPAAIDAPEASAVTTAKKNFSKAQRMQGSFTYDLIVVGAGPGGYVAAIRAAQLGAKVAVIEKKDVGGTCLNRGCIPTKTFYASAQRYRNVTEAPELGITVGNVSFDWRTILSRKNKIVARLIGGVQELFKKNGIELIRGEADIQKENEVLVDGKAYTTEFTLIATGTKPASVVKADFVLPTTDEILDLAELPKSIAIIGGGVIGCEIAGIFNTLGVRITMIELLPHILPLADGEVRDALVNKMTQKGIRILTNTSTEEIAKNDIGYTIRLSGGETIDVDLILEATGRTPDGSAFAALDIKQTAKGYIETDEAQRTSRPAIYAIGDITGKYQLAHAASEQGIRAAEHMFGENFEPAGNLMPSCIFADLEIASVGITEEQAAEQGLSVAIYKYPYAANGKALTLGESEGFVKVIADARWGEILGVHIIGAEASNLIEEAVAWMQLEATAESAGRTIHPHPTLSEMLAEAFLGTNGEAIHF